MSWRRFWHPPVPVSPRALLRDKKGAFNLVLLGEDGGASQVAAVPEVDVRRALDELIAD